MQILGRKLHSGGNDQKDRGISSVLFVSLCVFLLRQFFYNVVVFAEVVFFFGLGNGAVFNGFLGAVADAGHAVCTLIAPDRQLVFQCDVIEGAQLYAFPTADAGICCMEILRGQLQFAPDRIEGDRDDGFEQEHVSGG